MEISLNSSVKTFLSRLPSRLPLLGMVLGCFLGVLCAENTSSASGLYWLLVLPVLFAVWCHGWKTVLFFGAWALLWGLHAQRLETQGKLWSSLQKRDAGVVALEGVITKRLDSTGYLPGAWMRIKGGSLRGVIVGLKEIPQDLLPGDCVKVVGDLRLPQSARNPSEMDLRAWYRRIGLAGELEVQDLRQTGVAREYSLIRWSWLWRGVISERLVRGMPENCDEALLIKALVLGDRSQGGESLFGVFRQTGTMHVFAVSGLHVGLVALLAWLLVRALHLPRSWGLWLVIVLIWSYAGVTGLRPPVMRAATMGTFVLVGFVLRREAAVGNALLASVPVVLFLDSFQWKLPGFQLSYAVVAVIILLVSPVTRLMQDWVDEDPFLPRALYTKRQDFLRALREKLGALFAVSGTAWLGSFPLMRWYFGVITPMAVPASMVLVPVVFVILAIAFGALLLGLVWPQGGAGLNSVNGALVRTVYGGVELLSDVPGGQLKFREHEWGKDSVLVFSLADGGAATFVDSGGGVLIDVASVRQFYGVVKPALNGGRYAPDSIVLTHPDGAHVGGALPAIEEWSVKQVLVPTDWARSPAYRALLEHPDRNRPQLKSAQAGMFLPLEKDTELEVVSAPTGREDRLADDRGLVLRLHWEGWKILFTGDAGFVMEKGILEKETDVSADVLVMGRHDSDFSGLMEFIQSVGPRVIISSDSGYDQAQRIPLAWEQKVEALGIELWRLSDTGAVEISPDSEKLLLRSFLEEEKVTEFKRN